MKATSTRRSEPMATKTRARFAEESESSSEPANKNTRALRYDSLASVLTNLDKQATVLPGKFKLDRISSADSTELARLRANVASMKAENQRLVESLTDELNQLAERVTELEDRARRPCGRRAREPSGAEAAP